MDFDFENEIKELGTCVDFSDMDEDMWVSPPFEPWWTILEKEDRIKED